MAVALEVETAAEMAEAMAVGKEAVGKEAAGKEAEGKAVETVAAMAVGRRWQWRGRRW